MSKNHKKFFFWPILALVVAIALVGVAWVVFVYQTPAFIACRKVVEGVHKYLATNREEDKKAREELGCEVFRAWRSMSYADRQECGSGAGYEVDYWLANFITCPE